MSGISISFRVMTVSDAEFTTIKSAMPVFAKYLGRAVTMTILSELFGKQALPANKFSELHEEITKGSTV